MPTRKKKQTKKGGDLALDAAKWAYQNPNMTSLALAPLAGLAHYGYYRGAKALTKKLKKKN